MLDLVKDLLEITPTISQVLDIVRHAMYVCFVISVMTLTE